MGLSYRSLAFAAVTGLTLVVLAVAAWPRHSGPDAAYATFPGANGDLVIVSDRTGADSQIFRIENSGANPAQLTSLGQNFDAAWSPDGTRIVFASERDGNREIYVMNADGSGQTRLTDEPAQDFHPAWSADGGKIAFRTNRGPALLWVMDADGGNPQPLIDGMTVTSPEYSPDGTRIAFADNIDGDFEIFVANADGSNPVQITNNAASDNEPSWSPDSTRIAFDSDLGVTGRDVWVMEADGSNPVQITSDPAYDGTPAWSPDGTKIAFYSDRSGGDGIHIMDPDGSSVQPLSTQGDYSPDWQPLAATPTPTPSPTPTHTPTPTPTATPGPACPGAPSPPGGTCPPCPGFEALSGERPVGAYSTCPPSPTPSPAPATLTWGNNDCDDALTAVDALVDLLFVALLPAPAQPAGCPLINDEVDVANASPHIWGDVDCSGAVDSVDALRVLREVARLGNAAVAGCPDVGDEVLVAPA